MRESILTIPISEIFEPECGCPICRMRDMLEKRTVEYIMGAAMMEPDVRIETNRQGFCREHFSMMQKQKNRLSLALMLQTHLEEQSKALSMGKIQGEQKKTLFSKVSRESADMTKATDSCFVCGKVQWGMERLMKTLFEMYCHEDFRALFNNQEYLCLPHYRLLGKIAPDYLKKEKLPSFLKDIENLAKKHLDLLYEDVSKYCSMYDYRNTGKEADWGNSKDSIERAILFLTSRE